jgi:hypothetical protein
MLIISLSSEISSIGLPKVYLFFLNHSHPIDRDFSEWLAGDPTQDHQDDYSQTSPSFLACFQYAYSERLKSTYSGERSLEYIV